MDAEGLDKTHFDRHVPDNCVEYLLFVLGADTDGRKQLSLLEGVRKAAVKLVADLTKDYIWQRDGFGIEVKNDRGLVYLYGATDYGDSVEDEWLIVYMLRELTKSDPALWVRVSDSDGEFLLIEAAKVVPKWLNPENDLHRVWLHGGRLVIIPLGDATGAAFSQAQSLTLNDALHALRSAPGSLVRSEFIEAEAFYRLEKYPEQIVRSLHHSLVTIPRKLAYVIHSCPKSIAPAIEAFYLRDGQSLKPLFSSSQALVFPPKDLVTVSLRFTKVLFAQVKSQNFDAPPEWAEVLRLPQEGEEAARTKNASKQQLRLETGMKLTCGFEMMTAAAGTSDNRLVREIRILLDDLEEDGEETLPSDDDIKAWPESLRDDDETWMDINYDDFERELQGERGPEGGGFGDPTTQADLRKLVSRFEAFLNDDGAGPEGAIVGDDEDGMDEDEESADEDSDEEDKEVSFDEEQFAQMMREMMGVPVSDAEQTKRGQQSEDSLPAGKEPVAADEEKEDEEIKALMTQMETELNEHGVLRLSPTRKKLAALKGKKPELGGSGAGASSAGPLSTEDTDDSEDSEGEVDLDYNLAKNILESFKSQAGAAGPAGNILSMMGMRLPRDEGDESEDTDIRK